MAPPPSSFLSPNFPILAIVISGILTTFFILVSFYFFVTRCHLRDNTGAGVLQSAAPVVPFFPLRSQGLQPSLIRAIPIVRFSKSHVGTVICTICLNEYHAEERLRLLPSCSHVFHIDCIDTWLQSNANCPLCRVSVTNNPTSLDHDRRRQHHGVTLDRQRGFEDEGNVMITRRSEAWKKADKWSLGDDCIVHVRENNEDDELFRVQPIRRSLSLDSSSERQVVYLSVQEMLQKKQKRHQSLSEEEGEVEDGGECSSRSVQPCFAFGQGRSWRKPVHAVG